MLHYTCILPQAVFLICPEYLVRIILIGQHWFMTCIVQAQYLLTVRQAVAKLTQCKDLQVIRALFGWPFRMSSPTSRRLVICFLQYRKKIEQPEFIRCKYVQLRPVPGVFLRAISTLCQQQDTNYLGLTRFQERVFLLESQKTSLRDQSMF